MRPLLRPRRRPEPPPRYRAAVRGRVVDANGTPVAGLDIVWTPAGGGAGRDGEPRDLHSVATTDARGVYEANLLPPGPCRMLAARNRWFFATGAIPVGLAGTRILRLRQDATVDAPDLRLPIDPRMFGTLDVTVVDPSGRPVKGASVYCNTRVHPWASEGESKADASGRIRLTGVNPGEVSLHASGPRPFGASHLTTWLSPGARGRVRVVLPRVRRTRGARRRIRVACRDDTGRPLAGCRVYLFGFDTRRNYVERRSDRRGVAILEGYLSPDYGDSLHGSAWKLGHDSTNIQAEAKSPTRTARVRVVLRRVVLLVFEVVDETTGARVRRTSIDIQADGKGAAGIGAEQGVIGPDPPEVPRFLWFPSHHVPIGRVSLRFASPGYLQKSVVLRVRPRTGYRRVVVKLTPAR